MRFEKSMADLYIEKTFVEESEERIQILKELDLNHKSGIQVSPCEGLLLKFLSQAVAAKKIVEIGTLFGYSTSWFLESLGEAGKVWSFEKDELHYKIAARHLDFYIQSGQLEIIYGSALQNLTSIESKGPFDLIFIDANKSGYMDYFNWADKNIKSGGLIIADNTFLFGEVFKDDEPSNNKKAWRVMRELNETIARSGKYTSAMVPTKEGLTLAYRK